MTKCVVISYLPNASLKFISQIVAFLLYLALALGSVLLAIVLMIIVLYVVYLRILRVWCKRGICSECEKYLCEELDMFIGTDPIRPVLDEAMKAIVREYEQEYLTILKQIFSGSGLDPENNAQKEINRFHELKESWGRLKYE